MSFKAGSDGLASDMAFIVGCIIPYAGRTAPTNWLMCDGTAVSRTTYADLFGILCPSMGTVTMTIATPCVVTKTSHGLATGDSIYLTTSGALPTGLTANTKYWVVKVDANTFNLATSLANALAGTKIATSGSQSGTHTMFDCPYGVGDGSTTFNLPDTRGKVMVDLNQSDAEFSGLGQLGGEKAHQLTTPEMPSHTHGINTTFHSGGTPYPGGLSSALDYSNVSGVITATGGDGTHNNIQPYIVIRHIIRGAY